MNKDFDIAQLVIDEIGLQALGEEPPDAKVVAQRVAQAVPSRSLRLALAQTLVQTIEWGWDLGYLGADPQAVRSP